MPSSLHIKIGRSKVNHVVVENESVADEHLELFCDERDHVFVTDLNSIQGTFINGKKLKGYTLLDENDVVVLGNTFQLNWKKYREIAQDRRRGETKETQKSVPKPIGTSSLSERETAKPKVKTTSPPRQSKQENVGAKVTVSNRELFIIYGLIVLVIFLMVIFG